MSGKYLVITSIASSNHPVLQRYAEESILHDISLVIIGDVKSPSFFYLPYCDFYSVDRQRTLSLSIVKLLPQNHYARKNIGYLVAMLNGAEIIIETDDDNLPFPDFWSERQQKVNAHNLVNCGWVNIYRYFTDRFIWPRGFALEFIQGEAPPLMGQHVTDCPIQQGLATEHPDVDALFRLTQPLPVKFSKSEKLALGRNSFCPFNSQNTTWFKEAFPLLYLPSYCSFRMTDIWRSFIAQRIAWECDWNILFHQSTVWQERNDHNLLDDFKDEIPGYLNNGTIFVELQGLKLKKGKKHIPENLIACYRTLINMRLIDPGELNLLLAWIDDLKSCKVI